MNGRSFLYFCAKIVAVELKIEKNGKKRFVSEFSPTTIGKPCPFQEEWQRLWNLGDKVNTKGNELFPSITEENILYFASNGHEGLGGARLY